MSVATFGTDPPDTAQIRDRYESPTARPAENTSPGPEGLAGDGVYTTVLRPQLLGDTATPGDRIRSVYRTSRPGWSG